MDPTLHMCIHTQRWGTPPHIYQSMSPHLLAQWWPALLGFSTAIPQFCNEDKPLVPPFSCRTSWGQWKNKLWCTSECSRKNREHLWPKTVLREAHLKFKREEAVNPPPKPPLHHALNKILAKVTLHRGLGKRIPMAKEIRVGNLHCSNIPDPPYHTRGQRGQNLTEWDK